MSRLIPTNLFSDLFPDRKDPMNPKHYLCRYCGKPTIDTRRKFYCSDGCYWLCQRAVSWRLARRLTWERDGKKCSVCHVPVDLYHKFDNSKHAEIHHIIPVSVLWGTGLDALYYWKDNGWVDSAITPSRRRIWAIIYTLLYLDINNLTTLCVTCHKWAHKKQGELMENIIPLEKYFLPVQTSKSNEEVKE